MTEKEIAEIRRRFKTDKNNITKLRGCYVNNKKEIISEFTQSISLLSLEESESIFKILKRTLSGSIGKNLNDIEFSTEQVSDGEEHKLLMKLKDSELNDEDAVKELYGKIINSYITEDNYLILLACDVYDIPTKTKNDEELYDASEEVFTYFLCSICPVKLTKSGLGFFALDNSFRNIGADMAVSFPETGFMFPSFDDRSTNIYNALYYTRSTAENHKEFAEAVFNTYIPMSAEQQKETFRHLVSETADDECSYEFVQSVHEHLTEMIEEHKNNKSPEPLILDKKDVKRVLESCGATEQKMVDFEERYNNGFGERTGLHPQNIIDPKQFEIKTPDVTIKVNPEKSYMLETKIIDGVKYIMIRAEEGVEVNGVNIFFSPEENNDEAKTDGSN